MLSSPVARETLMSFGPPGGPQGTGGRTAWEGPNPRPAPPDNTRRWLIGVGVLVVVTVAATVMESGEGDSAISSSVPTSVETTAPATEDVEEPAVEVIPERDIERELTESITAEVPTASVIYTEADNTVHLIAVTTGGIRAQTRPILAAVKASEVGATLRLDALADLKDEYGDSTPGTVLRVVYMPDTIARINPDGINLRHIWEVADESYVHPVLRW